MLYFNEFLNKKNGHAEFPANSCQDASPLIAVPLLWPWRLVGESVGRTSLFAAKVIRCLISIGRCEHYDQFIHCIYTALECFLYTGQCPVL